MKMMDRTDLSGLRVICAVSGGADSVYLLHKCCELRAAKGLSVCAAHYNHCLRGEESERDERFVRSLCEELGVELKAGRGDVAAYARENKLGIEEAARRLRYEFLERAADELGCEMILTAHNADDNAETVLMALARGAGPRGLAGIPPVRGRVARPMLDVTRAEIERYLAENGFEYVEDSTNASTDYTRNRIRKLVMPVLREINPRFAEAASRSCALLRQDDDFLEKAARLLAGGRGEGPWRVDELRGLHESLLTRIIRHMAPQRLSYTHVEAVLALIEKGAGEADVPGARFRAEGGELFIVRDGAASLPERELAIPGLTSLPEAGLVLRAELVDDAREIHTSLNTFYFQYENICGTISCAARRPGDAMRPAGRGCTKKLKDLFAEARIPPSRRALIPVLRDGRGVLAAAGFGQDERTLPSGGRVLRVSVERAAPDENISVGDKKV